MKKSSLFLILFTFCISFVNAQNKDKPLVFAQIIDTVFVKESKIESYALYIPSSYNPDSINPVIFVCEPGARGSLAANIFKSAAEKFSYIIAVSNNSNNTRSYEDNEKSIKLMINDVKLKLKIDKNRIYLAGFSGGSRLATAFAVQNKKITGVIGCGAGLMEDTKLYPDHNSTFMYYGIVGRKDMNMIQMVEQIKLLNNLKIKNRLRITDSGHFWPDSALIIEALEWFEFNKTIKSEQFSFETYIHNRETQLNSISDERPVEKTIEYESFINDFTTFENTQNIKTKFSEFKNSKGFSKREKRTQKIFDEEKKKRKIYINNAYKLIRERPVSDSIKSWWVYEIKFLKKLENKASPEKKESASRLLNMISSISIEWSYVNITNNDYEGAYELIRLGVIIFPESPYYIYNEAKIFALLNKKKDAVKSLEKAIKFGLSRYNLLNDPAFNNLKDYRQFKELKESVGK